MSLVNNLFSKVFLLFTRLTKHVVVVVEDGRFPYGSKNTFLSAQRLAVLESLGMMTIDLPDTELLERAQSILGLLSTNQSEAVTRTRALLQYMDSRLTTAPDKYSKCFLQTFAGVFYSTLKLYSTF